MIDRLLQPIANLAVRILFALDQHLCEFANDTDEADQ